MLSGSLFFWIAFSKLVHAHHCFNNMKNHNHHSSKNFARKKELQKELEFQASRSGGPGGQNVNKVNSKVTLIFDLLNSPSLSEEEKAKIGKALEKRINKEGKIILQVQSERSQLANKQIAIQNFERLINSVFVVKKKRKATRPTLASRKKRLDSKKKQGDKKQNRRKVDF